MGTSIPDMQVMIDPFVGQKPAEMTIVVEKWIGVADDKHDVDLAQLPQPPFAGKAW
jgi:hypothetical protein